MKAHPIALAAAVLLGAAAAPAEDIATLTADADRCDFLDPGHCLLPWPSDHLTVADPTTDTGRRLDLDILSMPRNVAQVPINPIEWNRNDGWSPGQMILTLVEGMDLEGSGGPLITDLERSLHPESATVIVNAETRERHLHWAELDFHATGDGTRLLILRPAINLEENTRYVVAVQNAVDRFGDPIPPSPTFEAYRDELPTLIPAVESRRADMEEIFQILDDAGVDRQGLTIAWDFTVASERSLSERVLFMRDDGFASLGGASPAYTVNTVTNDVDDRIYRRVEGTFQVPRYVNSPQTGGRMTFLNLQGQGAGLPDRYLPDQEANFLCNIPRSASDDGADPANPARPSLYGHGLLGGAGEANAGNVRSMANEHNFIFCATDWIGMSQIDLVSILTLIVPDLSNFPTIPDRLQQAFVNFLFLARLLIHPDGFVSDPAFQTSSGAPLIDTSEVYYDGNSQGGIAGGAVMAISTDVTKGVLGVPAMNYSTLLRRSVDFDPFKMILDANYQNEIERSLVVSLLQNLWDRGEANGYAHHMTDDPLPNTPAHRILLHEAFGDHQVANVATEVEARTIGAQIYQPAMNPGRHSDLYPFFGIPPITGFPHPGSALVVWDTPPSVRIVDTPPTENHPPRTGSDPHEDPRADPDARVQKSQFLSPASGVIDVCAAAPCIADRL